MRCGTEFLWLCGELWYDVALLRHSRQFVSKPPLLIPHAECNVCKNARIRSQFHHDQKSPVSSPSISHAFGGHGQTEFLLIKFCSVTKRMNDARIDLEELFYSGQVHVCEHSSEVLSCKFFQRNFATALLPAAGCGGGCGAGRDAGLTWGGRGAGVRGRVLLPPRPAEGDARRGTGLRRPEYCGARNFGILTRVFCVICRSTFWSQIEKVS